VLNDMKATLRQKVWSVGLLLAIAYSMNAMPPVPHRINGGIERIDGDRREVVITNASERVTLTWKESARLEQTCLNPGDQIKAYYRKEGGRLVIRDVQSAGCRGCRQCN
jgi:hypothetical protein